MFYVVRAPNGNRRGGILKIMLCINAAKQAERARSKPCLFRHSCFHEQQTEQSRVLCPFGCIYRVCRFTHNNDARGLPRAKTDNRREAAAEINFIFFPAKFSRYSGRHRVLLRRAAAERALF